MAGLTEQDMIVDINDEMPIAVRRKRRASAALGSPHKVNTDVTDDNTQDSNNLKTPTKSKKRVRFSDPGRETLSSTGITPYVQRTTLRSFSPSSPRLLSKPARRRRSMPTLSTLESSAVPKPFVPAVEVHFAPLRQVLDERVKRRLRRSHLSEVINDIESEKKLDGKRRQEIRELKEELALARQLGSEIVRDSNSDDGNTQRVRELEEEICHLKEEVRGRSMTAEPSSSTSTDEVGTISTESIHDDSHQDQNFQSIITEDDTPPSPTTSTTSTALQTTLTASEIASLQDYVSTQTNHLVQARLDLEYICPGESTLGLTTSQGNSKPVLEALLERLSSLKSRLQTSEAALAGSKTQESNLRVQFNTTIRQLEQSRTKNNDLSANNTSLATAHSILAASVNEKERSIEKLSAALNTYRAEVHGLESLITGLEGEHKSTLATLSTAQQTIRDLECYVAAEMRGRRTAEADLDTQNLRIQQLECQETELKAALGEKQRLLRALEDSITAKTETHEQEVGSLNTHIASLASSLSSLHADLAVRTEERNGLAQRVEEEKSAGLKAVESLRTEIRVCGGNAEALKETYEREVGNRGEVRHIGGLMTPVSAGRFRDAGEVSVEGGVVVGRGKRGIREVGVGRDSGIEILEEEEMEEEELEEEELEGMTRMLEG